MFYKYTKKKILKFEKINCWICSFDNLFTNLWTHVVSSNLNRRKALSCSCKSAPCERSSRFSLGNSLGREFLVADGKDNSSLKCSNLGEGVLGPCPSLSLSLSLFHCIARARRPYDPCKMDAFRSSRAASFSPPSLSYLLNRAYL